MFPKKRRLSSVEVREILKRGQKSPGRMVSARYLKRSGSKAAVVVSGKVARRAVERNRIRRLAYRALAAELPSGIHAVFLVHSTEISRKDLSTLCSKLS